MTCLPEHEDLDLGLPRLQGPDPPDRLIDARHGRIGHLEDGRWCSTFSPLGMSR